jgi:tRNA-specific 2-thiouridylase
VPLYVLHKDVHNNTLVVGGAEELGRTELTASQVNWISGVAPADPLPVLVKIRYKAQPAPAVVTPLPENKAHVRFEYPLRDITPGQAAVFYDQEICLGGGII